MSEQQNQVHRVTVNRTNNTVRGYTNLPQNYLDSNTRVTSSRQVNSSSRVVTGHQGQIQHTSSQYISGSRAGSRRNVDANGNFEVELGHYVEQLIVNGDTDFATLKNMKDSMMLLTRQFEENGSMKFDGQFRENFQQRLLLLEHDFEGLMRRFINLKYMYPNGENRNIDYSKFISEKETMINDLERKIARMYDNNKPYEQEIIGLKEQNKRLCQVINQQSKYIEDMSRDFQNRQGFIDEGLERYLAHLEKDIARFRAGNGTDMKNMEGMVTGWIQGLPQGSQLKRTLELGTLRQKEDQHYLNMKTKLEDAQSLFKSQMQQLRYAHPHLNLPFESKILELLSSGSSKVGRVDAQGYYEIEKQVRVERQIPIQDERTTAMIRVFGRFIKRIIEKYPKLKSQMDVNMQQYLNDSLLDMVVGEDLDRLISITRIVPQMVKVQNVYTHSSQKQRKVQFHLRVLIKALLEEFSKAKAKGYDFQIDEGVIGMVRSEVMDLVDLDDLLAVFRPLPKIVEVPKVIEKVVESIVPIPHRFELHHKTADVTGLQKQVIAQDSVGIPLQDQYGVRLDQEVAVELNNYAEKIVHYTSKEEIPFTTTVHKTQLQTEKQYREKPVPGKDDVKIYEKTKIAKETDVNIYNVDRTVREICDVIHQQIKPVEHIMEKVIEKVVTIENAIPVEVIRQMLVKQIQHTIVKEEVPYPVYEVKIEKQIRQKLVEAIQTREVLRIEPQMVEKLVEVPHHHTQIKYEYLRDPVVVEKPVTEEVVVYRDKVVEKVRESTQSVDRVIEKPIFKQVIKVVNEIEQVPFVDEIIKETFTPIVVRQDVPIIRERAVEVPVSYPVYIKEEVPVYIKEQNTYPVPYYYDRIKPEIQIVQKIVEKIVEVPRTVEVEKIVEKIVVVPRIVEKIVEVPQIVEKIVEKQVQVVKELPPIERNKEVPVFTDRPVQVIQEKIVTIIQQVEKILNKQIPIKDTIVEIRNQFETVFRDKIVDNRQEVPVYFKEQIHIRDGWQEFIKEVPVEKQVLYPVKEPHVVRIEVDKPIEVPKETTHVVHEIREVEKIVPLIEEKVIFQPVDLLTERVVIKPEIQVRQFTKVVVDKQIEAIQTMRQKIVELKGDTVQRLTKVPWIMQTLIEAIHEKAKVFEYAGDKEIVPGPTRVEVIRQLEPVFVNINRYIETIVDKVVQVPYLLQECTPGDNLHTETMVPGPERYTEKMKEVHLKAEKEVIKEVMKTVQERVNVIEQSLKMACERIQTPSEPVIITKDKLVEMPMVLEKIVEKITVMPQVHEILKYVHEMVEEDNISALSDLTVEVKQYKQKSAYLDSNMGSFIESLKKLKSSSASQNLDINGMIDYMQQFRYYLQHPKLFQRIIEQPGEKQVVRVPRQKSAEEARQELARVLLIEELLGALTKLKVQQRIPIEKYVSEDVMNMFSFVFEGSLKIVGEAFNKQMKNFQNSVLKKFSSVGGWDIDHNMMLKSFIDERFQLATGIKSLKKDNQKLKLQVTELQGKYNNSRSHLNAAEQILEAQQQLLEKLNIMMKDTRDSALLREYEDLVARYRQFHIIFKAYYESDFARKFQVSERQLDYFRNSKIRELTETILRLEQQIRQMGKQTDRNSWNEALRLQNDQLITKIALLKEQVHSMREKYKPDSTNSQVPILLEQISRLKQKIRYLQQQITHGVKYRDFYEAQTSIASHTNLSPTTRRMERTVRPESESDGGYGANFGEYMNNDPSGLGMIESRKNVVYQSSVSNSRAGNLANSTATYRTNNNDFSSAKHIGGASYGTRNMESSHVNRYQGQAGVSSSFQNNNVQMTTSRVQTEHRIEESGQMTLNKPVTRTVTRTGQTTTTRGLQSNRAENNSQSRTETNPNTNTNTNKYQYYNSRYTSGRQE